jgi:hypothetical protein
MLWVGGLSGGHRGELDGLPVHGNGLRQPHSDRYHHAVHAGESRRNIGLQWETQFAGDHTFVAARLESYQSMVYGDAFNNPYNRIPMPMRGNLRLTWRGPRSSGKLRPKC